jgi:hypothetical protein
MGMIEDIRRALEDMAKKAGPEVSNIAKVQSVNESAGTCVLVDDDGLEYFDVRLRPVQSSNKSFIMIPKIGSLVLTVRIEDADEWLVIACDEIEKVGYYIDGVVFEVDSDGFLLKKQNETLKQLMSDLLTAIEGMSFTVATPDFVNGSTTAMVNVAQFSAIKTRFNQFLKS